MAELGFNEAYRTAEFSVEIEGIELTGVTKVSGISEGEVEAVEQHDGGSPFVHKVSSGIIKYDDLTLERYMDGSDADTKWQDWWKEMFKLDGTGTGSKLRRSGSIVKKQHGEEVMRFVFEGAWIKSSKISDMDAASDGLMVQTMVLAIERMERVV